MASIFWDVNYEISQEEIKPVVVVSCLQLWPMDSAPCNTYHISLSVRSTSDFTHTVSMEDVTISSDSITLLPAFASRDNDLLYQLFIKVITILFHVALMST